MNNRYYIIFFICILFVSCSNKKQLLYGAWRIGSIKSEQVDYEDQLLSNNFFFINDGELGVPRMVKYPGLFKASWDIEVKDGQIDSLLIEADNYVYEGNYKVRFLINNVNSRLFMELKSNSKEIVLYNYFKTKKERDSFILNNGIKTNQVQDDYFPQLKQFPDNWKTFD